MTAILGFILTAAVWVMIIITQPYSAAGWDMTWMDWPVIIFLLEAPGPYHQKVNNFFNCDILVYQSVLWEIYFRFCFSLVGDRISSRSGLLAKGSPYVGLEDA